MEYFSSVKLDAERLFRVFLQKVASSSISTQFAYVAANAYAEVPEVNRFNVLCQQCCYTSSLACPSHARQLVSATSATIVQSIRCSSSFVNRSLTFESANVSRWKTCVRAVCTRCGYITAASTYALSYRAHTDTLVNVFYRFYVLKYSISCYIR